jgi:hypothetical protein
MNPLGLSTKLALIFGALLLMSGAGNIFLARHLWQQEQKDADATVLAKVASERDGLKLTAKVNEAIAGQKATDTAGLVTRLEAIASRGENTRIVYHTVAARTPLSASCAPGKERVDAVNDGLGPLAPPPSSGGTR